MNAGRLQCSLLELLGQRERARRGSPRELLRLVGHREAEQQGAPELVMEVLVRLDDVPVERGGAAVPRPLAELDELAILHHRDGLARELAGRDALETTVERVAAGQFTREAIAVVKNRQFIEFCERAGDRATATLYKDVIEPDERFHHELGRSILLRLATTPEAQAAARRAATRTLELAEELQAAALRTAGIHHAPGC